MTQRNGSASAGEKVRGLRRLLWLFVFGTWKCSCTSRAGWPAIVPQPRRHVYYCDACGRHRPWPRSDRYVP